VIFVATSNTVPAKAALMAWAATPPTGAIREDDIRSPPILDHIPLYSPVYGGGDVEARVEPVVFLSRLSLPLSPPSPTNPPTRRQRKLRQWPGQQLHQQVQSSRELWWFQGWDNFDG